MARIQRHLASGIGAAVVLCGAGVALAHPGHAQADTAGFAAGAMHPLTGADHLLAVLASGLLAVRVGTRRALWVVPASFIGLMLLGGALAFAGVPMPHAEWGISLSVIVLGVLVAMRPTVPLPVAASIVGLFAVCHGHAHVAEMAGQALLPYMAGFTLATLALHLSAIALGLKAMQWERPRAIRFAGAAIAAGFAAILILA